MNDTTATTPRLPDEMSHKPITERAVLVDLHVAMWGASIKDPLATAELADEKNASAGSVRVSKQLISKEALQALRNAANGVKQFHHASTLPWNDRGVRMLPVGRVDMYQRGIDGYKEAMVEARQRFVANYATHISEARRQLGDLFQPSDYPSAEDVEGKIGIDVEISSIPDRTHFVDGLLGEDEERIRADVERRNQARIQLGVEDLFAKLGEAVARLADRMGMDRDDDGELKERKFKDTVVTNLKEAAQRARDLDVTGNDVLADLADRAAKLVDGVDVETLRPTVGKKRYDMASRERLQKGAEDLKAKFAGYFGDGG